jgi:hypothetical protein
MIEKDNPEIKNNKYVSKPGFEKTKVIRCSDALRNLIITLRGDSYICGGYARYICSPNNNPIEPHDLDIFTENKEVYADTIRILEYFFCLEREKENDISLLFSKPKDFHHPLFALPNIQLIKPKVEGAIVTKGSLQTILENFDFTVVRAGLLNEEEALVDADFMHDEKNKIIRIKNIHCPISSTFRIIKYSKKGYWCPTMQIVKLFVDWDMRPDEYKTEIIEALNIMEMNGELTKEQIDHLEKLMRVD